MQQTTYGEIPKKSIFGKEKVEKFLTNEKIKYSNFSKGPNCLYQDQTVIADTALNYLNAHVEDGCSDQLKMLIRKEFIECESMYPYLGDLFIQKYFADSEIDLIEKDNFVFTKESAESFISTLKFKEIAEIADKIIKYTSLQYSVSVESTVVDSIFVEKNDFLNFDVDYDFSFLGGKRFHKMKDYNFIIIDGYIESVGEIHHLLDKANRNKEPYVVFCFGMSPEVEHIIKYNNAHSKFEIFPCSIKFDENTINVLSDIAVLHQDQVVSAKSGQTISKAVRDELKRGQEITFSTKGFRIKPVASELILSEHRKFLNKRVLESSNEENSKLLRKRIKSMSSKSVKIFIPELLRNNNSFIRELDYLLRFLSNCNKKLVKININKKQYILPTMYEEVAANKAKSLKSVFKNTNTLVINARN